MKISVSITKTKDGKESTLEKLKNTSADFIHVDTMDGKFVSQVQQGIDEVVSLLKNYPKPLDIHLMVENPKDYIEAFKDLNVFDITIHSEIENVDEFIDLIHSYNIKAGLAINPDTPASSIIKYLKSIDLVLIMGVFPGLGGQGMIEDTTKKIDELIEYRNNNNLNFLINFDGGVNDKTRGQVSDADILVSGSYICLSDDLEESINTLKEDLIDEISFIN